MTGERVTGFRFRLGRARSLAARNRLEEALIEERQRRLREAQPPLDAATFLRSFRPKPEPGVWRAKVAHAVDLAGIASRLKA